MKRNWLGYLLLAAIALIPFSFERNVGGVWLTSLDGIVLLMIAVWAGGMIAKRDAVPSFPLLPLTGGLLTLFAVSVAGALVPFLAVKETVKYLGIFLFFYVLVNTLDDEELLKRIPLVVSLSIAAVSVWLIIDFLSGRVPTAAMFWDRTWHRKLLKEEHLNAVGTMLTVSLPFSLFELLHNKKPVIKIAAGGNLLLQMTALVLTNSRGNWIATGLTAFVYFHLKYKMKGFIYFAIFLVFPFILSAVAFPNLQMQKKLFSLLDRNDGSVISRKAHMQSAYELLKMKPLNGVGLDNYQLAAKKYLNVDVTEMAHNIFLQIGAEAGMPALILLLIIVIKYFFDAHSIYVTVQHPVLRELLMLSALGFMSLIISAQFGDPFVRSIKEYFALTLALPYAIRRVWARDKKEI